MLINQTPLLDMYYDSYDDILRVVWPDIKEVESWEIKWSIQQLHDTIKGYFISRLLVDASLTTKMLRVETLMAVWEHLADVARDTRLQKIARIRSASPAREALAQQAYYLSNPESRYPQLQFQQFVTEAEAMRWLLSWHQQDLKGWEVGRL